MNSKLLLIAGPAGVGKSTVIRHLQQLEDRFDYIGPYMTRPLRLGETEKISISCSEMERLWNAGELVVINELYGVRYGTPRKPIECALESGRFPVIDWPITHLDIMETAYPSKTFVAYLKPPSVNELVARLRARDQTDERIAIACDEMVRFENQEFDSCISIVVVSNNPVDCANTIWRAYLDTLNEKVVQYE